jgi:ssDNA-binding Zn-finger/Zn-ribbon topoisomerase 1
MKKIKCPKCGTVMVTMGWRKEGYFLDVKISACPECHEQHKQFFKK